jgi:hypothetical protein
MDMAQGTVATVSLGLLLFVVGVLVVGIYVIHSLPGRIAASRGHPQTHAIEVCSVLGLLAFPLWMAALIWAYAGTVGHPLPEAAVSPPDTPPESPAAGDGTLASDSPTDVQPSEGESPDEGEA